MPAFFLFQNGIDVTYGRNAGGKKAAFYPVFLEPGHPLDDFAGHLGPPKRIFGIYIGRDGPPGIDYWAPPAYYPLPDFAAMGYWQEGDTALLAEIAPLLKGVEDTTDWAGLLKVFRKRLKKAIYLSVFVGDGPRYLTVISTKIRKMTYNIDLRIPFLRVKLPL